MQLAPKFLDLLLLFLDGLEQVKPMGNMFDPGFKLYDEPRPCPYKRCSCKEFSCLDEMMRR